LTHMFSRTPLAKFEVSAYLLLIAGVVGDHLSTVVGLNRENVYESNPFAAILMQNGLWVTTDVALIVITIAMTYFLLRMKENPVAKYMLIYPSLAGLIRLVVTFSNISLIL
jgi:hypothetical protein